MSDFPELPGIGELGVAMRECTDDKLRPALKSAFGALRAALIRLHMEPTAEHLSAVNGAWSHAARVYRTYKTPAPPSTPISPPVEGALLQMAA